MKQLSEDLFKKYLGLSESSFLEREKQAHWQKAEELGLPTHKNENWKYTRLKELESTEFGVPEASKASLKIEAINSSADYLLVFENGFLRRDLCRFDENFLVEPLENRHLKEVKTDGDYFGHLAQAMSQSGIYLELKGSKRASLEISYVGNQDVLASTHLVGRVTTNSELTVTEKIITEKKTSAFINHRAHWQVDSGAHLKIYQDCAVSDTSFYMQSLFVDQKRDSSSELFHFSAGGKIARHDLNVRLSEEGASSKMFGLYLAKDQEQVDFCTVIEHAAPHCVSEQLCKGLLSDRGQSVFNGLVHIHRYAQKTDAAQLNKNLLLSPKAQVNTRPRLLVDADDVKATHGATVGQLDKEEVFYLQSRGLPQEQVVRMLAHGFGKEVIFKTSVEEVRDYFLEQSSNRMESMSIDGALS